MTKLRTKSFEYHGIQITYSQYQEWWEERKRLYELFNGQQEIIYDSYPLEPRQKPFSRDMVYPKHHGRCYWCGQQLTGRRRSFCKDEHRYFYWYWFSWETIRERVYIRDNGSCQNCGDKESSFEVDHIKAIALGGENWNLDNLQLLCINCHKLKTRKDIYKINNSPLKNQLELTEFIVSNKPLVK